MDTYLEIAAAILKAQRRPLSPEAMLKEAYRTGIVPPRLHGKTQHKTLHARISEEIVHSGEHSTFVRIAPGRFFLREFLANPAVPQEFREPFPTRRRFRELIRGPALALEDRLLREIAPENTEIEPRKIFELLRDERHSYRDPKADTKKFVFIRSFVSVFRSSNSVLSYRLGRYREDRDTFMSRRSIGFWTFVYRDDHTLFNISDFGILDAGVRATQIDLDIPTLPSIGRPAAALKSFMWTAQNNGNSDLLAIISFQCPVWFEPTKRRLALNDLAWLDINIPVNDLDDFDPWSRSVLVAHYRTHSSGPGKSRPTVPRPPSRGVPQVANRER